MVKIGNRLVVNTNVLHVDEDLVLAQAGSSGINLLIERMITRTAEDSSYRFTTLQDILSALGPQSTTTADSEVDLTVRSVFFGGNGKLH